MFKFCVCWCLVCFCKTKEKAFCGSNAIHVTTVFSMYLHSQEYSILSNVYTVFCVLVVPHELSGFELNCWGVSCQKLRFAFL